MSLFRINFVVIIILLAGSVFVVLSQRKANVVSSSFTPVIPRVWDDAEMASAAARSKGNFPCAPLTTVPSGITRV